MNTKSSSVVKSSITDGNDLVVEFVSGRMFCYTNAASLHDALLRAPSQGAFLNTYVKPTFAATQL